MNSIVTSVRSLIAMAAEYGEFSLEDERLLASLYVDSINNVHPRILGQTFIRLAVSNSLPSTDDTLTAIASVAQEIKDAINASADAPDPALISPRSKLAHHFLLDNIADQGDLLKAMKIAITMIDIETPLSSMETPPALPTAQGHILIFKKIFGEKPNYCVELHSRAPSAPIASYAYLTISEAVQHARLWVHEAYYSAAA